MATRPPTFDHLRKQVAQRKVKICLDPDALQSVHEAEMRLMAAQGIQDEAGRTRAVDAASVALDAARDQATEATVTFTMRSLGRKAWNALVESYPPTDEQVADAKKEQGDEAEPAFNGDTFPPAAVAACIVDPSLTAEQVAQLFDEWPEPDTVSLFLAAWSVNTQSRVVALGKASGAAPS